MRVPCLLAEDRVQRTTLRLRKAILVFLAVLLVPTAGSSEEKGAERGSGENGQEPILIRADRMEMRRQENLALYLGRVQASQRDYRLESESLELNWDPDGKRVTKLVARGGVRLYTEEGTASAAVAVLDVSTKTITMSGSPRLLRGEELVEGDRIIYSIAERKSSVLGSKGSPVKTRLIPGGRT